MQLFKKRIFLFLILWSQGVHFYSNQYIELLILKLALLKKNPKNIDLSF